MYSVVCMLIFDLFTGTLMGVSGSMDMFRSILGLIRQGASNKGRVSYWALIFTGIGTEPGWAAAREDREEELSLV